MSELSVIVTKGKLNQFKQISTPVNMDHTKSRCRRSFFILGVSFFLGVLVCSSESAPSKSDSAKGNYGIVHNKDESGIVLKIPQGLLKWNVSESREGRTYYSFYKIPYASPPLGQLRFESPQPPTGWDGVRFETDVAPECIQKSKYSPIDESKGQEDCLYVNIYTPKLPGLNVAPDAPLLPTLFYIHGGGFADGNGSRYGAKYFMDEDAVMVTFQYRLGALGFLSSETDEIKGNLGMKDQVQGLKWVRDNIEFFGGDPSRVMIYGNSAGGSSVNLLLASPMASGLFHRALTQSGPPFGPLVQTGEAQRKSFAAIVQAAGCNGTSEWLDCLRNKSASDLQIIRGTDVIFAATVETGHTDTENNFLPDTMTNLFKAGRVNKVPWMIGVTNSEWIGATAMYLKDLALIENLNNNFHPVLQQLLMNPYTTSPIATNISDAARRFYFGESLVGNETLLEFTNMVSDRDIVHPCVSMARWMAAMDEKVFLYYMSKKPQKSYADGALIGYPPGDYGASHADELQYLFNYYGYPEYPVESEYFSVSRSMTKFWVEFAATGSNPAPGWEPISREGSLFWYELNDISAPTMAVMERMQFWSQFSDDDLCYN